MMQGGRGAIKAQALGKKTLGVPFKRRQGLYGINFRGEGDILKLCSRAPTLMTH